MPWAQFVLRQTTDVDAMLPKLRFANARKMGK